MTFSLWILATSLSAETPYVSEVWVADNGDGTYMNPVLHADYSDPDVIRVDKDYYMVSSSFNAVPGLPILHSKDLVNWQIVGHALRRVVPEDHFQTPRHAQGVWAPSMREHKGSYYIFWGDPDFGIYRVRAPHPEGPWEAPMLVKSGRGLIDPSPFWDDDGRAYLVYAFAGSRAGIKSLLVVQEMKSDASEMLGEPVLAFDGHDNHETVEGPKFFKFDDLYYILAPGGGVTHGWQLAMRSKEVFGPYEEKIVLQRGSTEINGPHQGGLIDTVTGEWWFLHFQDKGPYGRVVHLNPVEWKDGWPMMGVDGEPVLRYRKPDVGREYPVMTPRESDDFSGNHIGKQWQWHGNPLVTWAFPTGNAGFLRLFATQLPDGFRNYWDVPHLLLQKFPAPEFAAISEFEFRPQMVGERTGLMVMGRDYSSLALTQTEDGLKVSQIIVKDAENGHAEREIDVRLVEGRRFWFRVDVAAGAKCRFSYSLDGVNYQYIGEEFTARQGGWIGAKLGIYCSRPSFNNDSGYADFHNFEIQPYSENAALVR
jgi:beta-xylosidase